MQNWVTVSEQYLDYLRSIDNRIPHSDYGTNKLKPFFGVLFEQGDLVYVTQISHAQPRHITLKNSLDFYKIFISDKDKFMPDRLVAVVNLNYMFPVHKSLINVLEYKNIDQHRTFESLEEKSTYIDLLSKELAQINKLGIESKAKKLYQLKCNYPENRVSKRCLDFTDLERYARKYEKLKSAKKIIQ